MINLVELLVAALATWQVVEIWNHGSIFATMRATIEADIEADKASLVDRILSCPFCLSLWAGGFLVIVLLVARGLTTETNPIAVIIRATCVLMVAALAVSRLANLANDMSHAWCRTPIQEPPEDGISEPADESETASD